MSRGKYKNAAEARQARESALSEVEAGRRTIVRLSAENAELKETLGRERQENIDRVQHLNALMAEGASPEIESLRSKVAKAEEDARGARLAAGRAIADVLRRRQDVKYTLEASAEICQVLGVKPDDLFSREGGLRPRRELRRDTPKSIRRKAAMIQQIEASGVDARGLA